MSKAKDATTAPPAEVIPPGRAAKISKAKAALAKLGLAAGDVERDPELEGLMAEIEADLREEELQRLWQRYGKYLIAVMAVALAGVIGFEAWRQHQGEQRMALATQYGQALADLHDGKRDDALGLLAQIGGHNSEGYATIAQLQRAAILVQNNDIDGAIAIYKAVAADPKIDKTYRDLAVLLQVMHSVDRAPPQTLEVMLAPLLNPGNPFNPSAIELSALLAAKEGDTARAAKLVDQILADPSIPSDLRQRAEDLAAYYKSLLPHTAAAAKN